MGHMVWVQSRDPSNYESIEWWMDFCYGYDLWVRVIRCGDGLILYLISNLVF